MKDALKIIGFVGCLLLFCLADNFNDAAPKPQKTPKVHSCRWEHCPYKNIPLGEKFDAAVDKEYDGEQGTDGWCIDMLHGEHPECEYDSLETMLFSTNPDNKTQTK